MSKREAEVRKVITIIGLIYAINAVVIVANLFDISEAIANAFNSVGISRVSWLRDLMERWTGGFFFGEIACVSLWANLSSVRLKFKVPTVLAAIVQVTSLLIWIGALSAGSAQLILTLFSSFVAASCGLVAVTYMMLWFSIGRVRFIERSQQCRTQIATGFTISQAFVATTTIAIALGAMSAGDGYAGQSWHYVLMPIVFSCGLGLLPTAALLIATSIRRLAIRILVCVILASLASALLDKDARAGWEQFLISSNLFIWIVLLPVLFIRIAGWFGYVVERVEREEKEEHSSSDADDALMA